MRKLAPILALAARLIPAAPAVAGDNGEGLYGETDDKVVTFVSLGVVIFFAVFVILASWLQATLDRRRDQRKPWSSASASAGSSGGSRPPHVKSLRKCAHGPRDLRAA